MIYYYGDLHGSIFELKWYCKIKNMSRQDTFILLGDVGANYSGGKQDRKYKASFGRLPPTFLCIHGNHEQRPEHIETYKQKEWNGGTVWYEEAYPYLLFAKDGEIYDIEGVKHLVIGGAYSVDKYYRLRNGYNWWADEQPSDETKRYVEQQAAHKTVDIILSHTCPFKYEPTEAFLPGVDQSTVDASTEHWLDAIEETVNYKAWLCGHWHIDKQIDRLCFLYRKVKTVEEILKREQEQEQK